MVGRRGCGPQHTHAGGSFLALAFPERNNRMPLSPEQRDTARWWLRDHLPIQPCLECGAPEFSVDDIVNLPPTEGGSAVPVLMVSCKTCRHIRFFAAGPM